MSEFLKPTGLNILWASAGDILDPGDTKYQTGWGIEIPPRQWENYIQNKQDNFIAHANQHGICVWDSETEYQWTALGTKSLVMGSDGAIYRALTTNTNQDPTLTVGVHWEIAFSNAGDFYTKTEADGLYLAKAQNLADLTNIATARTNLSVYSQAQTYTKTEVDAKTTVASTSQAQAWASNTTLITPLRLAEAFQAANQSLTTNGWQKLPGGIIIQWASAEGVVAAALGSTSVVNVTFPLPMDTLLSIQLTHDLGSPEEAGEMAYSVAAKSSTSASAKFTRVASGNPGSETVRATFFMVGI